MTQEETENPGSQGSDPLSLNATERSSTSPLKLAFRGLEEGIFTGIVRVKTWWKSPFQRKWEKGSRVSVDNTFKGFCHKMSRETGWRWWGKWGQEEVSFKMKEITMFIC